MSSIRSTSAPTTGQATPTARPAQGAQATFGGAQSLNQRIAMRAYEKLLKRGCLHGYDFQDWVEAEKELLLEQNRAAAQGARR